MQTVSMFTGKGAEKHGITRWHYYQSGLEFQGPLQSGMRRSAAIWNVVGAHGYRVGVAGWSGTWPAEDVNGYMVSQFAKQRAALGDWKHTMERKLQLTLTGTLYADPTLHQTHPESFHRTLAPLIEAAQASPDAELFARFPALAPNKDGIFYDIKWNYVANEIYVRTAQLFGAERVDFVAVVVHGLDVAFHRSQMQGKAGIDGEFSLLRQYYVYADSCIGDLLAALAADRTTVMVVSNHGVIGIRDHVHIPIPGIIVVRGPNIKSGQQLHGASILDVFPTILQLFGIPVPQDGDGEVLVDLFRTPPDVFGGPPVARPELPALRRDYGRFDDAIMERLERIGFIDFARAAGREQRADQPPAPPPARP